MSVREYIGARYVPIFSDPIDWDITKEYEPLTVVLDQGASYVSRQWVPAGVDILNSNYWILWADYNAQIAAYRAEVQAFDGRIDDVESATSDLQSDVGDLQLDTQSLDSRLDDVELATTNLQSEVSDIKRDVTKHMYVHILGTAGSCYIVEYNGIFVCYDVASTYTDTAALRSEISNILGDSKFSAVICSHFHYDHSGQPAVVAEFCDENTESFIQMSPTQANGDYDDYLTRLSIFTSSFPNATVPTNNAVHEYGDMKVRIFNTLVANTAVYDATPHDATTDFLGTSSGMNNYSLIAEFSTPAGTYCNTGDVEAVAQEFNAQFMQHADVLHNPHHVSNHMGYIQFFKNATPKLLETVAGVASTYSMSRRWNGVVVKSLNVDFVVNNSQTVTIDIHDGSIHHNGQYWTSPTTPVAVNGNHTDYYSWVNSSYDRNPWYIFNLTPAALVNFIQYNGIKGIYHLSTSTSGADLEESRYLFGELLYPDAAWLGITMTDSHTLPTGIYLDFEITKAGITFRRARSDQKEGIFCVDYLYKSESAYVTRYYVENVYSRNIAADLTFANTPTTLSIPSGEQRYLYYATNQMVVAVVDTNDTVHYVPVLRTGDFANKDGNKMEGTLLISTARDLIVARINTSGTISGFKFHLDGTASETLHIGGYSILG